MTNENEVKQLTDMVASFVDHISKKLPDDVVAKLEELASKETAPLPKVLYETMTKNQKLAVQLDRPSCQDTGVLQFWLKCGTNFPYINELEVLLRKMLVRVPRLYGGISFQTATSAKSTLIWQAAAAPFQVRQWF